jgi:hypothetical protein
MGVEVEVGKADQKMWEGQNGSACWWKCHAKESGLGLMDIKGFGEPSPLVCCVVYKGPIFLHSSTEFFVYLGPPWFLEHLLY